MSLYTWKQRVALLVVPPLAAGLIRLLGASLRFHDVTDTETGVGDTLARPAIFAFWHRSLLMAAYRFRGQGIAILISRSLDGELIARTVERLGFIAVRGSSSRGGSAGLRGLERAFNEGRICAFTADGPRGPAMIAKPGAAQLASLVDANEIGAFHLAPERAWALRSWDKFLVPKPFSRVVVAWPAHARRDDGEPIPLAAVQAALDRAVALAERALGGGDLQ